MTCEVGWGREPISMKVAFCFSRFVSVALKDAVGSLISLFIHLYVRMAVEHSSVAVIQVSQGWASVGNVALYVSRVVVPTSTLADMRGCLVSAFKDTVGVLGDCLACGDLGETIPYSVIIHG